MANTPKHLLAVCSDSGTASDTYLDGLPLKRHMLRPEILRVFQQVQSIPTLTRTPLLRFEKAFQDLRAYWNNSPELHEPCLNCLKKVLPAIPQVLAEDTGACFVVQDIIGEVFRLAETDDAVRELTSHITVLDTLVSTVKDDHCRKIQQDIKTRKRHQRKKREAQRSLCERLLRTHSAPLHDLLIDTNVIAAQIQASLWTSSKTAVFIEIDGVLANCKGPSRIEINPEGEEFIEQLSEGHELWLFNLEPCALTKVLTALDPTSTRLSLQRLLIVSEDQLVQQVRSTATVLKTFVVSYRTLSGLEHITVPVLPYIHEAKVKAYAALLRTSSGLSALQAAAKEIRTRSKGL
jgi:hypothetical protein